MYMMKQSFTTHSLVNIKSSQSRCILTYVHYTHLRMTFAVTTDCNLRILARRCNNNWHTKQAITITNDKLTILISVDTAVASASNTSPCVLTTWFSRFCWCCCCCKSTKVPTASPIRSEKSWSKNPHPRRSHIRVRRARGWTDVAAFVLAVAKSQRYIIAGIGKSSHRYIQCSSDRIRLEGHKDHK